MDGMRLLREALFGYGWERTNEMCVDSRERGVLRRNYAPGVEKYSEGTLQPLKEGAAKAERGRVV